MYVVYELRNKYFWTVDSAIEYLDAKFLGIFKLEIKPLKGLKACSAYDYLIKEGFTIQTERSGNSGIKTD